MEIIALSLIGAAVVLLTHLAVFVASTLRARQA